MSGRDYRTFLTGHRTSFLPEYKDTARLAVHAESGMRNLRYKEVDYDQLRALAQEKRLAANASLIKVKKLQKLSKDSKESGALGQHRKVWQADMLRLRSLQTSLQAAVEGALNRATIEGADGCLDTDVLAIMDYASQLGKEREIFKTNSVDPIHLLRQDLQYWIRETSKKNSSDGSEKQVTDLGDPQEILLLMSSVKEQQVTIMQRLAQEAVALQNELNSDPASALAHSACDLPVASLAKGIPLEAYEFDCPDEEIKVQLLQEFLLLDQRYCGRLQALDEEYEGRGRSNITAAVNASHKLPEEGIHSASNDDHWNAEHGFVLGALFDAYSCDAAIAQHKRHLVVDRLVRQWPDFSREELLEREARLLAKRSSRQLRKVLVRDWTRSRAELLTKVKITCMDLCAAQELQTAQHERLRRQQEICRVLFEKVHEWQEQKMEAMMLEQEILRERAAAARLALNAQQEKEVAKRTADKAKVEAYKQRVDAALKEKDELARERLKALQEKLSQQAAYDRERVAFREAELQRRLEEQLHNREVRAAEEEERERRLEALRETVRVNAERDPMRLLHDTESWQHKLLKDQNGIAVSIHQPLFDIHTFTDKQIAADPRVRLEQRLREAGLHATDYARQILSQIQGPQAPRRDAASTFKLE